MARRLILWSIIAIILLGVVLFFVFRGNNNTNAGVKIDKSKWKNENFDVQPIPEDQILIIEIVNQSFSRTEVELGKNGRIRFINKDMENHTLMIPLIGIEEELTSETIFEPTFYKEGEIEFWLKEIGYNKTKGIVNVTTSETS